MAISTEYYGTLAEANAYFASRLHERAWTSAAVADRPKSLIAATKIIDTLSFKDNKHSVHVLLASNPQATQEEIRDAEAQQALEFPRGADAEVPESIRLACYEIAYALLDGVDPQAELESLGISSQGYSSVRTTYNRAMVPCDHLVNGVPSTTAWRLLQPLLRESREFRTSRVS